MSNIEPELSRLTAIKEPTATEDSPEAAAKVKATLAATAHPGTEYMHARAPATAPTALADAAR